MEPLEYDIEFPRGNDCDVAISLLDANGEPLTPSAQTEIYFTLKDNYNKTPYVLQKKLSTGDITVEDGICSFTIEHLDTATLQFKKPYKYSVDIIDAGKMYTLVIGTLTLTENATHVPNE